MTFDVTDVKVSEGQKALAAYIKKETGKAIKPETISVIDALREAYRKDPERVAEREAVKAAARKRKEEQYRKAVEKAAALAKSLGMPGDFDVALAETLAENREALDTLGAEGLDEDNSEVIEDESDDDWSDEEPEPEPEPAPVAKKAPVKRAAKKTAAKPLSIVPPAEQTPADEDTSAIIVGQEEDGWEADPTAADEAGDDFFDDGAEEY